MSISAIYILNLSGKILLSYNYKDDIDFNIIDSFMIELVNAEYDTPILVGKKCTFIYLKTCHLYLISTTQQNVNAILIIVFLNKLHRVLQDYLKDLDEESIRDNFVLIYELLDELVDYGFPQITDTKILKEYIKSEKQEFIGNSPKVPYAVTNSISWRSEGIFYQKNEIFIDVIESINLLTNAKGQILNNEINGKIIAKAYLTGLPELRLGLNDKVLYEQFKQQTSKMKLVEIDGIKFHQCVRLGRFEKERVISFIPPDGEFELMSYRLDSNIDPLIMTEVTVENFGKTRFRYTIRAKSHFSCRKYAKDVQIYIPVNDFVQKIEMHTNYGLACYRPEINSIVWYLKSFPGNRQFSLYANFNIPSCVEVNKTNAPITIKFELPYFTISGIEVKYLKVFEKSGYKALPWVRYVTKNGNYQIKF